MWSVVSNNRESLPILQLANFAFHYHFYIGTILTSNYTPTVGFINTPLINNPQYSGTLRRPREYDTTPPRILSKIDIDPTFYYGWQLPHKTSAPSNTLTTTSLSTDPTNRDDQSSTATITLCPPGRTYCF